MNCTGTSVSEKEKKKKSRGATFTKDETLDLLGEIYKEKDVIECKVTNKVSAIEKEQAWARVARSYNSKSTQYRNTDQLKSKFDNLKTKARKAAVQQRAYIKGTGGGPSCDDLDPIILAVLKIINMKTVVGLQSTFDCDNFAENSICMNPDNRETCIILPLDSEFDCSSTNAEILEVVDIAPIENDASGGNRTDITVQDITSTPNLKRKVVQPIAGSSKKYSSDNWSHYVPRRLKEPISKRLRPAVPNPLCASKEKYYLARSQFFDGEAEAKKLWTIREEEIHLKKMKLLELEIQLKNEELKDRKNVNN